MWQNRKGKGNVETLRMIAAERDRILNPTNTSQATFVKSLVKKLIFIDNSFGYDHVKKVVVMH